MTQENSKKKWSAKAEEPHADNAQSLGSYLQRERQKKQLTIKEVAESTRIPPEALEALEAGNKNLLPVSVFTRGFVKIYAAHLGLNQAEILERFNNEWGAIENTTPEFLSGERMAESSPFFLSFKFYFLLLLITLLISLAYFFFQADDTPKPAALTTVPLSLKQPGDQMIVNNKEIKQVTILSSAPSQDTLLISPQSAGKIVLEEEEEEEESPHVALQSQELTTVADVPPTISSQKRSALAVQQPAGQSPATQAQKPKAALSQAVNLHIRFIKKTLISVAQDDDQPEKFLFTKGEESSWQAARHITLQIDDAKAVELTLNGSPITVAQNNGPLAITLPTDVDH